MHIIGIRKFCCICQIVKEIDSFQLKRSYNPFNHGEVDLIWSMRGVAAAVLSLLCLLLADVLYCLFPKIRTFFLSSSTERLFWVVSCGCFFLYILSPEHSSGTPYQGRPQICPWFFMWLPINVTNVLISTQNSASSLSFPFNISYTYALCSALINREYETCVNRLSCKHSHKLHLVPPTAVFHVLLGTSNYSFFEFLLNTPDSKTASKFHPREL